MAQPFAQQKSRGSRTFLGISKKCGLDACLFPVDNRAGDIDGTPDVGDSSPDLGAIEGLKIIRQLGRGSMGTIYEAEDLERKRRVAVKVLSPELCGSPDLERRFQREFSVLQAMRHPGLVHVLSSGKVGNALYFVMELLEGRSLRALIPISPDAFAPILRSLADSLDAAHDHGVVHGDVKPENIFVRQDERGNLLGTKLIDFGLSKVVGLDRLTATGEAVGTPIYMAPEIITGSEVDGAADIYALAVVTYETLCGSTPFRERNPAKLMFEIVSGTPTPLSEYLPDAPQGLVDVLARSLARDPKARHSSAGALAHDIFDVLELELLEQADDALA